VTIRLRLTLWYGLTFAILIGLAGAVVWWQFDARLRESLAEELRVHAEDVATSLQQRDTAVSVVDPTRPGVFTALLGPGNETIAAAPGTPPDLPQLPPGASSRSLTAGGPRYEFYTVRVPAGRLLIVGSSLAELERSAAGLAELLIAIGAACAAGALVVGWWLAGRALSPIRRMTREADAIGPGELDRRLAVNHPGDEVGRLTATLNGLLARIEDGVRRERSFVSGAAHDLRTPIAALRMQLDVLLRGDLIPEPARAPLEDASRDAIDLGELADALLGLADAQSIGPHEAVEDVVLPLLVLRAEGDVERLARDRTVRIEQRVDEASVRVSAVRFHQALSNLLANAVRHGPEGGTVELEARIEPGAPGLGPTVLVEVADRGPGIDPRARADLFVPFAMPRRDASTAHGLGLATAAAAVRSQGGEIGYRDRDGGGAVFWFRLPIQSPLTGTVRA